MREKITIALTGHRPNKLDGYELFVSATSTQLRPYYQKMYNRLVLAITNALNKAEIVECHSGLALGADTVWALAITDMQEKYPTRVRFVADIPDFRQSSLWKPLDAKRWSSLLNKAQTINTYAIQNPNKSYPYILNMRNLGMVTPCDVLICIYNGDTTGGTANAIKIGQEQNKRLLILEPDSFRS